MREVTVAVKGITKYSASKFVQDDIQKGETKDAHEKRRWREKAHTDEKGVVFIPGVAFKMSLDEAVALRKEKIKGKGNQTWAPQFRAGVVAMSDMKLGIKSDALKSSEVFCNADGKRGSGTRVMRFFPTLYEWEGEVTFRIFNDQITQEVFEAFFKDAGYMAGVGQGRPITGSAAGNGRFEPISFKWTE